MKVKMIFDRNEPRFLLNVIYMDPLIKWIQIDGEDEMFGFIKEKKTCDHYHILFNKTLEPSCTFDTFLAKFAEVFLDQKEGEISPKNRAKLTTDAFAQRWMTCYGPSTFLGLELFVPFSEILTDVYVGGYLNQQNTIEKVVGGKNIVKFANELLKVGSENA